MEHLQVHGQNMMPCTDLWSAGCLDFFRKHYITKHAQGILNHGNDHTVYNNNRYNNKNNNIFLFIYLTVLFLC